MDTESVAGNTRHLGLEPLFSVEKQRTLAKPEMLHEAGPPAVQTLKFWRTTVLPKSRSRRLSTGALISNATVVCLIIQH